MALLFVQRYQPKNCVIFKMFKTIFHQSGFASKFQTCFLRPKKLPTLGWRQVKSFSQAHLRHELVLMVCQPMKSEDFWWWNICCLKILQKRIPWSYEHLGAFFSSHLGKKSPLYEMIEILTLTCVSTIWMSISSTTVRTWKWMVGKWHFLLGFGLFSGAKCYPSLKLTAKASENRPFEKEISSSNHSFSGANLLLVSGRVVGKKHLHFKKCPCYPLPLGGCHTFGSVATHVTRHEGSCSTDFWLNAEPKITG